MILSRKTIHTLFNHMTSEIITAIAKNLRDKWAIGEFGYENDFNGATQEEIEQAIREAIAECTTAS